MLRDALIISLSRNFWDDVWRSRHQVMSRLARTNAVIFGSRPLNFDEAWPRVSVRSPLRTPGTHRIHDNLYAFVPSRFLPSIHRLPALEQSLQRRRRAELQRVARRWRERPQVLYLWHPMFESYIDAFPDSIVCYHLFDDLTQYGGAEARALERIFARADLVFASSEELADRYARFGNVHWVPNGVDYELFAAATAGEVPVPSDLERLPRPWLGYAGTLRAQIDVPLLAAVARARTDWSFVFIGDVSRGMEASDEYRDLRSLPNVHMLGPKTLDQLPGYLCHLDCGLLPYRLGGAARFCYPLKMHEYLAAGAPVVSTALVAVEPFTSVIGVAEGSDGWVRAIESAIATRTPAAVQARREVALANSWDSRVDAISRLIAAAIAGRHPRRETAVSVTHSAHA
jgi:glycosyltransferase involved in cell wall biosynthesis